MQPRIRVTRVHPDRQPPLVRIGEVPYRAARGTDAPSGLLWAFPAALVLWAAIGWALWS